MIPKNVLELCQSGVSVSAAMAKDPNLSPHEAAKKLFHYDSGDEKVSKKVALGDETDADLDQALACGNWGTSRPTRLFLRVGYVLQFPNSWGLRAELLLRFFMMSCVRWRRIPWSESARPRSWGAAVYAR